MGRKLIAVLICGILTFSLVSCTNKTEKIEKSTSKAKVEERVIEGTWAKDYTKDEITTFHNSIMSNVENLTNNYELKYEKKEVVKEESGEIVNSNEIYVENLNPEPNRLETMYYGFKIYCEDMSQGQLLLKIGFKLDTNIIKETEGFDLKETSIASYSQAVTGVEDRDYTDLNNKIYAIVNGDSTELVIENNLDGLMETVNVKDNYLIYKLETKKYNFKK